MEESRDVMLVETLDDKHSKRRSQRLRLMLRCFCFVTLALITMAQLCHLAFFQLIHDHHLQDYVIHTPFLRDSYFNWLEQFRNSPLIPRMLPNEAPAFDVVDSYDAASTFLMETKPPFFVLYYANWCPHSARAIPVVQEFAKTALRSREIPLMAIEADNPLSDNIDGFPTLYLYLNNSGRDGILPVPKEFTSKMMVTNLVAFLNRNVPVSTDRLISQKGIKPIKRDGERTLGTLRRPF